MITTKQVNQVVLRDNVLKNVIYAELYRTFREILTKKYDQKKKEFFSQKWIAFSMDGQKGYWNSATHLIVPVQSNYYSYQSSHFGISRIDIDLDQTRAMFGSDCPGEIMNGINNSDAYYGKHYVSYNAGSWVVENGNTVSWRNNSSSVQVGVVPMSPTNFRKKILSQKYAILTDKVFKQAVAVLRERSISDIEEAEINQLVLIFNLDRATIINQVIDKIKNHYTVNPEIISPYAENLLFCDKIRADLEKYDTKCLEDVNFGHWELWSDDDPVAGEGEALVSLEKPLIARNPAADIHHDGLIGIDFGTKSTIVSKQDGKEKTTLLRIGIGQLNKAAEPKHYENPTIMEFLNLEKFISDYQARTGRPETCIDDLRVSHTADRDLKSCTESDFFYSYFYDIKQWCGDTERNVKIIDQQKKEYILPAFIHLEDEDFNPLELYAYYLGLYINNMRNGIYLDYILSFPVTYEKAVKEKILSSFTKGLKKCLPESIQNNEEIMNQFRVRQGVSEPAAYAITALQGYGFEPDEEENIFYAIFDFGGGTTDFDFGLWRCAEDTREEERYDYVIEHFGSEGDKYLGGENLLELMAFEVFKANAHLLQKGKKKDEQGVSHAGFSFSKPKECDEFPGSETLISNSQEARRNTKQLMEALRPFWEGIIGFAESGADASEADSKGNEKSVVSYQGYLFRNDESMQFPINLEEEAIMVDLFDKDGKRQSNQKLYIKNPKENISVNLIQILEKRIERGVANFFDSVMLAFANQAATNSGADKIQIFLAGNSSKSPILKKIFQQHIDMANAEIKNNFKQGDCFALFPPLGTKEAVALQHELGIESDENDISAPTCKTGVA